jgi:hypothetical protein
MPSGRSLLVRLAPLVLGGQGHRAASEVATGDHLAGRGRLDGQGVGAATKSVPTGTEASMIGLVVRVSVGML